MIRVKIESCDRSPSWEPIKGSRLPLNCKKSVDVMAIWTTDNRVIKKWMVKQSSQVCSVAKISNFCSTFLAILCTHIRTTLVQMLPFFGNNLICFLYRGQIVQILPFLATPIGETQWKEKWLTFFFPLNHCKSSDQDLWKGTTKWSSIILTNASADSIQNALYLEYSLVPRLLHREEPGYKAI